MYVCDYGRGTYTVANQQASYNASTHQWLFNVQSNHITPGKNARPWVRAKDIHGNWSAWKYVYVYVQ